MSGAQTSRSRISRRVSTEEEGDGRWHTVQGRSRPPSPGNSVSSGRVVTARSLFGHTKIASASVFFFFITLLSLELSDTKVYEP